MRLMRSRVRGLLASAIFGCCIAAPENALAQLQVGLEVGPDSVRPVGTMQIEVTATNSGAAAVANVSIQLDLPAQIAAFNQTFTSGGGTCVGSGNHNANCDASETVTWVLGTLAPGARATVTLAPQVPGGGFTPPNGTAISFTARVLAGAVVQASTSESTTVQNTPNFELSLDDSADPVAPGALLTYRASFSNVSAASAAGATLTLTLPAGTTFVSATGGGSFAAGVVSWSLGTLPAGYGATREATVQVGAAAVQGALLQPVAQIQAPSLLSARSLAVSVVQAGAPLLLEIEAGPDPVRAAETMTVELTVTNVGSATIEPVVELRLAEETAAFNQNYVTHGGTCVASGNVNANCDPREILRWDVPPLAPGERITVQAVPQIPGGGFTPPNGAIVSLHAEAFEPLAGVVGARRIARQSILVHSARPLELALDESADPVSPNGNLTYTATFSNVSAASVAGAVLTLPLPPGLTFLSASDGGSFAGGVVTWALDTLPPGHGGTRQVLARVDALAADGAVLRADAQLQDSAVNPNTARARAVTVVRSSPSLLLEIAANPDPVRAAETLDVLLTVTNIGSTTINPILDLRIDEETAAFNENLVTQGGTCAASGNVNANCDAREILRWTLPALAPGERTTVWAAPQVPGGGLSPSSGTIIPLRAEVFESIVGAVGVQRMGRQSVLVNNVSAFELSLDESPDPAPAAGDVSYTASFGNTSAVTAAGTTLSLPLPPGTTFVSATGGGSVTGGVLSWKLGAIPAGRGGVRSVTLHNTGGLGAGTLLRTVAQIQDSAASPNTARATAVTALQLAPPLRLALTAAPNPALPGTVLSVPLTVTNLSGQALSNIALETRVPDSIVAFLQANATGAADCTQSGNLNTLCDLRELVRWTLPGLGAGAQTVVAIPPQISAGGLSPPNGTLIRFIGIAGGSQAVASQTVRIGISEDQDGDGLSDWLDNCPFVANTNQADTGGIGVGSASDGVGDACQCGDVNGDGRVTLADAVLVQRSLLQPPTATLAHPERCDVGAPAGCSLSDAVIIRRTLLSPPTATISQSCAPAKP